MDEAERLRKAIEAMEAQRDALGDEVVESALEPLRAKLEALEHTPTEERRQVTILFADVSGFTAMAEKKDPERVREAVNALWSRLDAVIVSQGGTIDKHIGDAVMALFGAPRAREDDPVRAVKAALGMQAALRAGEKLSMRIGIHTGPVIVGVVGTTSEYTALGDAVNTASRIETAAPVGGILISRATYKLVEGIFDVEEQLPISLKGKSEPLVTYQVNGLRSERKQRWRGVQGVHTRMVGRDQELQTLAHAFDQARELATARMITITGEAGLGKSRLIWGFQDWIAGQSARSRVFKARVTQETRHIPYSLFRDLFLFHFKIQESDPPSVARRKLSTGIEGIPALTQVDADLIGHLIGLDVSDSPHVSGILDDPAQIRDRAFDAVRKFLDAATREQRGTKDSWRFTAVVRLEDLHWADQGSLDLIEFLLKACSGLPVLFICTARPQLLQKHPNWAESRRHLRMHLEPLDASQGAGLVREILQNVPEVPEELVEKLASAAGGNPFYLEELVNSLIEDGTIETGDSWAIHVEDIAELHMPSSLASLLQTRLDRLSEAEREVLQQASVLGRRFWDEAIAPMTDGRSAEDVGPILDRLSARELIMPVETSTFQGAHEYAFRHALLYDAVYESVLLRLRPAYHAVAADWLTARSGGSGAWTVRIALHWERAERFPDAGVWYARGARHAQDTFANTDAIAHGEKAIEFLPEDEEYRQARIDVLETVGLARVLLYQVAESVTAFEQMKKEADGFDSAGEAKAWLGISRTFSVERRTEDALHAAEHAERLARKSGDLTTAVIALVMQGWCYYILRDVQSALNVAGSALESCAEDNRRGRAMALRLMSNLYRQRGDYEQALSTGQRALHLWRQLGDQLNEGRCLGELGDTSAFYGDYEHAGKLYREALALQRSETIRLTTLLNLAVTDVHVGDAVSALERIEEILKGAPTDWVHLGGVYAYEAEARLRQGEIDRALEAANKGVQLASPLFAPTAWRILGKVAAVFDGDITGGPRDAFAKSRDLLAEGHQDAERARTLRAWAEAELTLGDVEQGQTLWEEAKALFQSLGLELEVERMRIMPSASPARLN